MVKILPGVAAVLIMSIPGEVHDVEGSHTRPPVGEFFDRGALKAGESIHRDDLNALAPSAGLGGQPGLRTYAEQPGVMSLSLEGPLQSRMCVKSKMTVTYLSTYGVRRRA